MKQAVLLFSTVCLLLSLFLTTCTRENEKQNVIHNAVRDVDGNCYDAVRIGKQVWMKTNLRTKHFRDGSKIPIRTGEYDHDYYVEPCVYEIASPPPISDLNLLLESDYNIKIFGAYYNYPAVTDERGLCPKGWHVPTVDEFIELIEYVGSIPENTSQGNSNYTPITFYIAKALSSNIGWADSYGCTGGDEHSEGMPGTQPQTNNNSGFSALPAGCAISVYDSVFMEGLGYCASFMSCSSYVGYDPIGLFISFDDENVTISYESGESGCSVRCVRD